MLAAHDATVPKSSGRTHTKEQISMKPNRKAAIGALVVGASLTGGALGASMVNGIASAQTSDNSSSSSAPATRPVRLRNVRTPRRAATPPTASRRPCSPVTRPRG